MFSKNDLMTKPILKNTFFGQGISVFNEYINLSNNLILVMAKDKENKITTIKIYSIQNLLESLKQETFLGSYRFLAVMPDNSVLFTNPKEDGQYLIRICSSNLSIISSHLWEKYSFSQSPKTTKVFRSKYKNYTLSRLHPLVGL